VDLKTGKHLWATFKPVIGEEKDEDFKNAGSGTAFLVKNGDRFFIFAETGDLVIAKLSPEKYEEVSRAHLLDRTNAAFGRKVVWSHPAFADRCVFARNDKEIVCASLAER
jgi:outer membrane protein assembly factor BamB